MSFSTSSQTSSTDSDYEVISQVPSEDAQSTHQSQDESEPGPANVPDANENRITLLDGRSLHLPGKAVPVHSARTTKDKSRLRNVAPVEQPKEAKTDISVPATMGFMSGVTQERQHEAIDGNNDSYKNAVVKTVSLELVPSAYAVLTQNKNLYKNLPKGVRVSKRLRDGSEQIQAEGNWEDVDCLVGLVAEAVKIEQLRRCAIIDATNKNKQHHRDGAQGAFSRSDASKCQTLRGYGQRPGELTDMIHIQDCGSDYFFDDKVQGQHQPILYPPSTIPYTSVATDMSRLKSPNDTHVENHYDNGRGVLAVTLERENWSKDSELPFENEPESKRQATDSKFPLANVTHGEPENTKSYEDKLMNERNPVAMQKTKLQERKDEGTSKMKTTDESYHQVRSRYNQQREDKGGVPTSSRLSGSRGRIQSESYRGVPPNFDVSSRTGNGWTPEGSRQTDFCRDHENAYTSRSMDMQRTETPMEVDDRPLEKKTKSRRHTRTFGLHEESTFVSSGLNIFVVAGDIANRENIECVVNLVDENMTYGTGILTARKQAAGEELEKECKGKTLKAGGWKLTSAGNLPYKRIIHVAFPKVPNQQSNSSEAAIQGLKTTLTNTLRCADDNGIESMALSGIGTGHLGISVKEWAQVAGYVIANCSPHMRSLKRVHITDESTELVKAVKDKFEQLFKQKSTEVVPRKEESSQHAERTESCAASFAVTDHFSIIVKHESITEFDGDAIVITDDTCLRGGGVLAKLVCKVAGKYYENERDSFKGTVKRGYVFLTGAGDLKAKKVMHGILTSFGLRATEELLPLVSAILHKAESEQFKKIAMPLIGTGLNCIPTGKGSELIVRALLEFAKKNPTSSLREVTLMDIEAAKVEAVCVELSKRQSTQGQGSVPPYAEEIGATGSYAEVASGQRKDSTQERAHKPEEERSGASLRAIGDRRLVHGSTGLQTGGRTSSLSKDGAKGLDAMSGTKDAWRLKGLCCGCNNSSLHLVTLYKCDHAFCADCLVPGYDKCRLCGDRKRKPAGHRPKELECPICITNITDPLTLSCKHVFCKSCIDQWFAQGKKICPLCKTVVGQVTGNQPDGSMDIQRAYWSCAGHEPAGTIEIRYNFPDGVQQAGHPNPGWPYRGASRTAYLPDIPEGRKVLELLRRAFDQKLIFTVGTSVTTGRDNVVTWNDIHHKTSRRGGPDSFGYPDPSYLTRVQEELRAKGITE